MGFREVGYASKKWILLKRRFVSQSVFLTALSFLVDPRLIVSRKAIKTQQTFYQRASLRMDEVAREVWEAECGYVAWHLYVCADAMKRAASAPHKFHMM